MANTDAFLTSRTFSFVFTLSGRHYRATLSIPDLSANHKTCWGDWGPMYSITLRDAQSLNIVYQDLATGQESEHEFRPRDVRLNSPMLARIRETLPFTLEVVDDQRGLKFVTFLDNKGHAQHTDVTKVSSADYFAELAFPESRQSA